MAGDFILSLRLQDTGGEQREEIFEEVPPAPGLTRLIFIHGFGVHRAKAMAQWETLRSIIGIEYNLTLIQPGLLLWPSDQFKYPKMIRYAEKAGRKLGTYLRDHPGSPTVLVAHSLGARVALEAADSKYHRSELHGLALLGAAVSASRFDPSDDYGETHAKNEAVGYSPTDRILKDWFPKGEWLAAPADERDDAVGLYGNPETRNWERRDSKSNDHSYWQLPVSGKLTRLVLDSAATGREPSTWIAATYHANERSVQCQRSSIEADTEIEPDIGSDQR